jgi:7-carboxy-7-deazaguanine synthase
MYSLKEIYYTIQGEGFHTGRPAVFCRFSGCNLWSGLEKDRSTAICKFCDTNFWGTDGKNGGKYSTSSLVEKILDLWPESEQAPFVVCTGGEPLLQLDTALIDTFHQKGIYVAIETNGTIIPPDGIDWICVSPKIGSELLIIEGDELKLVYPQEGAKMEQYEEMNFDHFSLQPLDDANQESNVSILLWTILNGN